MKKIFLSLLALPLISQPAMADWVMLKNGDRLSGSIIEQTSDSVSIETSSFGLITLSSTKIASVHQGPAPRVLARELRTGIPMSYVAPAQTQEQAQIDTAKTIETSETVKEKPKREIGVYKWSGRASAGGLIESGNNDSQNFTADLEIKARDKNNRFTVGGEANYGTEDDERTDNDQQIYANYDRFLSEQLFIGARQSLERDEFEELDYRSQTGVFAGYQIYEQDDLNLQIKVGPEYIYEKFDTGETEKDIALGWLLDYDQKFLDDKLQAFHNHEIATPVADANAFLLETETGLRVPITEKLDAAAQVDFDWDNDPVDGVKENDTTYSIKLGYGW